MAVTLVGSVGAVSQGAASAAVTPAYGQTPTVNNLLVLYVAAAGSATLPAAPSGWSVAVQWSDGSSLATASIFYKTAVGGDAAPTVAGVTSAVLSAQLREFNNAVSQPDQTWHANTITTPLVATATSADRAPGDLVVACGSLRLGGGAATRVTSHTFNNGATSTETSNDATSTTAHYNFSHGVTTGNASPDSDSFAFTSGTAFLVVASFATGNSLQSIASMAGVPTNGMTIYAYNAGRFALPATDAAVPDGLPADYGPFTSANDPVNGSPAPPAAVAGDGFWSGTVSDQNVYLFTASGGGDGHTYWLGPVTPQVSTTQQAYSSSIDQIATRELFYGTIASGSNAVVLPAGSIQVTPVYGAPPISGTIAIRLAGGIHTFVSFTGRTGPVAGVYTLTGCSGGSGTLATGYDVDVVFQSGAKRRIVDIFIKARVTANGDLAYITPLSTVAGVYTGLAPIGFTSWSITGTCELGLSGRFEVDPMSYYGIEATTVGGGTVTVQVWRETDG